ncbi:Copia protein, partial [Mucuna pruriens]
MAGSSNFVPGSLPVFDGKLFDNWRVKMLAIFGFQDVIEMQKLDSKARFLIYPSVNSKIFNKISNASTSKEAWEILVKTYGHREKNKKVKLQTLRSHYELLGMEDSESIANYFDRIQELVNAMRAFKEKVTYQQVVDKILRTLPPEFDYVATAIEESKDLDTMEVEELQHSLEAHGMRVNKRKFLKEQAFQARTNYKGKGKDPRKGNKSNTKQKHQDQKFGETSESSKERRIDQASESSKEVRLQLQKQQGVEAGEGTKNKPNNRAHLVQDEGTNSDSEAVVLLAITSNEAQPRIPIEEEEKELIATPVFNKASTVRRPLQLRDQELFQDSAVNLEGELIHSALIVEAEPIEFEKGMIEEKWLKAMKDEINSIEKNQTWELVDPPSNKKLIPLKWVYKVKVNPRGEVVKNKARLVAKGFLQKAGIDYGDYQAGSNEVELASFKKQMMNEFEMSELGLLSYFLGIEFEMTQYGMVIHQIKYANDLLKRLNMQQSNPVGTPAEVGLSLKKETDKEQVDPTHCRRIVGCLRYLCNTRPDLNFSVGLVNRFMQEPKQSHLLAAKRILRYVQRTVDFGILFPKEEAAAEPELVGYSDSDWCGDKQDRKSTAGYIFFYGGALISWSSTKEPIVTLSSCEAEYIAASEIACQAVWLDALLENYKRKIRRREQVSNEKLQIEHCRIEIQFADIFTKALKRERFSTELA